MYANAYAVAVAAVAATAVAVTAAATYATAVVAIPMFCPRPAVYYIPSQAGKYLLQLFTSPSLKIPSGCCGFAPSPSSPIHIKTEGRNDRVFCV